MAYRYRPYQKERDWDYKKIAVLVIILGIGAAVLLVGKNATEVGQEIPGAGYTPISLVGISERGILLGDRCNNFEIPITSDQLFSISSALSGGYVRPLTHDIYKSTLDHFEIQPIYFSMDRYDGDLWYATLRLKKGAEILDMEVRPSDGVAMSVRYDLPMFIDSDTYSKQAKNVC